MRDGIKVYAAKVEVLQRLDAAQARPGVLTVALARMAAGPGAVKVLQRHIGYEQGEHLFDLRAQRVVLNVFVQANIGRHVLNVVAGRVVLVVSLQGGALNDAANPTFGLGGNGRSR